MSGNIAKEITRIHCDATGAPASFLNVLFHETHEGRHFVAGQRPGHSIVFDAIRQGRSINGTQPGTTSERTRSCLMSSPNTASHAR